MTLDEAILQWWQDSRVPRPASALQPTTAVTGEFIAEAVDPNAALYVGSSWIASIQLIRPRLEDLPNPQGPSVVGRKLREYGRTHGTLYIRTKKGRTLIYGDVSEPLFREFYTAPSKGRFYNRYIKGKFVYTRG
jgi:hypothetical protein